MRAMFILPNPDGTCRIRIEPSWNTPDSIPGQLAKFDMDNDALPTIPDGPGLTWDGTALHPASQAWIDAQDAAQAAIEADRINTPVVFDQPIEAPVLVLQSHEALTGVGVISDDAGSLVTFTYHASPVPSPAEIRARKDAAIQARADRKARITDAGKAVTAAKGKANGAGNSVASLRAAVADLAAAVEALTAEIN